MTIGKDQIANDDGVRRVLRLLRGRLAPDAIDAMYPEVLEFANFKATGQTTDASLMEFDVLREKAEARLAAGSGFPDEFVSIPCAEDAFLFEKGEPLPPGGLRKTLASPVAGEQIGRLARDMVRQDVLLAVDVDSAPEEECGFAVWVA